VDVEGFVSDDDDDDDDDEGAAWYWAGMLSDVS
jgi:hypothetical protein